MDTVYLLIIGALWTLLNVVGGIMIRSVFGRVKDLESKGEEYAKKEDCSVTKARIDTDFTSLLNNNAKSFDNLRTDINNSTARFEKKIDKLTDKITDHLVQHHTT